MLSAGEGSHLMDEVECIEDPLFVLDLHALVQSTGTGTGTKGAAICGGLGGPLIQTERDYSCKHRNTQSSGAYLQ